MNISHDIKPNYSPTSAMDYKALIAASPIAFYTTDAEGIITFFNQAAVNLWGRTPETYSDQWCGSWKIYYPDGKPMPLEECPMALTLKNGVAYNNERISIERPDGSFRNLVVFPQPLFDPEGNLTGAHNTLVDITEQKINEIKRATLSSIVESSDDAIISKDLEGKITSWNTGAERILKFREEEMLGRSMDMLIPEERQDDENIIMKKITRGERVEHFETVRLDKFGNKIPLSLTVSPVKDVHGRIIGVSKVARDITERLHGEEKQSILSAIVESSDDAIISKNLNGIIMSWNRGAEQIFGYKEEEVLGRHITILIPEERLAEEDIIINKIKNGEKVDHFETIRKARNGAELYISLTVSPIRDSHGKIVGASKIARDVSPQVRTQQQLEKYTRHLEILNYLGKSISRKMDAGNILQQVTNATTSLTGAAFGAFIYKPEEGEDYRFFTRSGSDKRDLEELGISVDLFSPTYTSLEVIRISDVREHYRLQIKGGSEGDAPIRSLLSVPVVSSSGEIIGGLLFGHPGRGVFLQEHEDLVSNIASQASISLDNSFLFEQVKNLSDKKDEFIALASHELKTPLTTIKGYLQVLSNKDNDSMSSLFLNRSLGQVNKLNTLVQDLLNMSRLEAGKLEFQWEEFDLRQLLLEMTETFGYSNRTHKLIYQLGQDPVIIMGDKQRIEQAVINLMNNAVKYSPKADKAYLILSQSNEQVQISIRDEGIGLTENEKKQIFTRYFRAKGNTGISGLGLGLYLTKEIISRHQGKIEVKSEHGKGSEFIIHLPKVHEDI